jgi:hypothetical protein
VTGVTWGMTGFNFKAWPGREMQAVRSGWFTGR